MVFAVVCTLYILLLGFASAAVVSIFGYHCYKLAGGKKSRKEWHNWMKGE